MVDRILCKRRWTLSARALLNGRISVKGHPGDYFRQSQGFTHDGSEVIRDLGLQYTSFDKVVLDTVSTSSIYTNVLDKIIFVLGDKYTQYYTISCSERRMILSQATTVLHRVMIQRKTILLPRTPAFGQYHHEEE
jgi:hypothetical protein